MATTLTVLGKIWLCTAAALISLVLLVVVTCPDDALADPSLLRCELLDAVKADWRGVVDKDFFTKLKSQGEVEKETFIADLESGLVRWSYGSRQFEKTREDGRCLLGFMPDHSLDEVICINADRPYAFTRQWISGFYVGTCKPVE